MTICRIFFPYYNKKLRNCKNEVKSSSEYKYIMIIKYYWFLYHILS